MMKERRKKKDIQSISHHSSILCISKVQGFGKVFLRQQIGKNQNQLFLTKATPLGKENGRGSLKNNKS